MPFTVLVELDNEPSVKMACRGKSRMQVAEGWRKGLMTVYGLEGRVFGTIFIGSSHAAKLVR
jgi:hypothetical protein